MNINMYSAIFNETKISRIIQYMTNCRCKTIVANHFSVIIGKDTCVVTIRRYICFEENKNVIEKKKYSSK